MKTINVRSVSIAIIALIILIEFIELFAKPENTESSQKQPVKNKEEKSSLLRKIVKIHKKDKRPVKKEVKKPFEKDGQNNYYGIENREVREEKTIPVSEELEVLGSKTIEINTVIEGNRIYMEKKEKIIQD